MVEFGPARFELGETDGAQLRFLQIQICHAMRVVALLRIGETMMEVKPYGELVKQAYESIREAPDVDDEPPYEPSAQELA